MTRTKGSSFSTTLPSTRRNGAFRSSSRSLSNRLSVLVVLGTLLGSPSRRSHLGFCLILIFHPQSGTSVTIFILFNGMLWRQRDWGWSNVRLKNEQDS